MAPHNKELTNNFVLSFLKDYPSPGLVREVLLESNVVPIFAVSAKEKPTYEVSVELKNVLIKVLTFRRHFFISRSK